MASQSQRPSTPDYRNGRDITSENPTGDFNVIYEPLNTRRHEIRPLQLSSVSDDQSLLHVRLSRTPLLKAPRYIALSYVWRDPSITGNICVNEKGMPVTTTLVSPLRHVRQFGHVTKLSNFKGRNIALFSFH